MSVKPRRIGLDRRSSGIYLAEVQVSDDLPEILALRRAGEVELAGHPDITTATIACTFPDRLAQVKTIHVGLDSRFDIDDQVAFELSQSLLESPDNFSFESINTGFGSRHLGFISRREQLKDVVSSYRLPKSSDNMPSVAARCRALALGLGYINYCIPNGGELVVLVDLGGSAASIAIVLGQGVVGVAWLPLERFDLSAESGREKLAVELKTLINYNLSALMSDGISQPMTALLVSGDGADEPVSRSLDRYFSGLVRTPRLRAELFKGEPTIDRSDGHKFVTALGLTVE